MSEICPSCGFTSLENKNINYLINGGNNTALIPVNAEVCEHCGEILFTQDQVENFEDIKKKLENEQTENFIPIGKNYKVA